MTILALDLGKFNTMCCFFDTKTRKTELLTATTDRHNLSTVFKKRKSDMVVMEACGPSGWINDLAISHNHKTLVCSTNEDAWKWSNVKRKTDKNDALKVARMASMNELQAVHMPSEVHREFARWSSSIAPSKLTNKGTGALICAACRSPLMGRATDKRLRRRHLHQSFIMQKQKCRKQWLRHLQTQDFIVATRNLAAGVDAPLPQSTVRR